MEGFNRFAEPPIAERARHAGQKFLFRVLNLCAVETLNIIWQDNRTGGKTRSTVTLRHWSEIRGLLFVSSIYDHIFYIPGIVELHPLLPLSSLSSPSICPSLISLWALRMYTLRIPVSSSSHVLVTGSMERSGYYSGSCIWTAPSHRITVLVLIRFCRRYVF